MKRAPSGARTSFVLLLLAIALYASGAEVDQKEIPSAPIQPVLTEGPVDTLAYVVGPGDVFLIAIMGERDAAWRSPVSPEGTLAVPPAGAVHVAGLPLSSARERILGAMAQYYHGVGIQVTLVEVRRFKIHVLGQVKNPGTYTANALTRVSAAIDLAGGLTEQASKRNIGLLGVDGSVRGADVLRFEMLGERDRNPFIADGDVIQVPVRKQTARVFGRVALPDEYEIVDREPIAEILALAGGFMDDAVRDRVEVERFLESDPSRTRRFFVDFTADPPRSEEPDLNAQPGDGIFVRGIPQWQLHRGVSVEGEVLYPGAYVIEEGKETLAQIIERAGGFTEDADLFEATLTRQSFQSEAQDREFERLKLVPVADMTEDEYAYFKMRSRENRERVVVDFVSLFRTKDSSRDILLRRGDVVRIPQITKTVTVSGQVVNPGRLPFKEGASYREYVREAGGFAKRASKGKVRIIKGVSGIWFDAGRTGLEPGDTIWIPEKPQRDYWELFKDFMTVAAQIATVYLVVDTATGG